MHYRLMFLCALSHTFGSGYGTPVTIPELSLAPRGSYKGVGCDDIMVGKEDTDLAVGGFYGQCKDKTESIFNQVRGRYCDVLLPVAPVRTMGGIFYTAFELIAVIRGPKCYVGSANHALNMISDQCGLYGAGSYSDGSENNRQYSYGYTNWRQHSYCNVTAGTRM